jgi:hypothetical protein
MKLLFGVGISAGALLLAAPANADTDDQLYLNALHNYGMSNDMGDQAEINIGHAVCRWRSQEGYSELGVATHFVTINPRISMEQAWFLLRTAEAIYCPWEIP